MRLRSRQASVIHGARHVLTAMRPIILLEINDRALRAQSTSGEALLATLRTDFNYEMQMAGMNGTMAPGLDTVFLPASPGVRHITGTLVRQIALMGGDVSPFVSPAVVKALAAKRRGPKRKRQTKILLSEWSLLWLRRTLHSRLHRRPGSGPSRGVCCEVANSRCGEGNHRIFRPLTLAALDALDTGENVRIRISERRNAE